MPIPMPIRIHIRTRLSTRAQRVKAAPTSHLRRRAEELPDVPNWMQ
ncbi:MAG: hypothetical protein ACOY0T_34095 [Myxococcota bacterium]